MLLQSGSRLGPYEIVSALGEGGMGEVYRARDARLGRDVAIEVLPAAFSFDPDRLRRFDREAKTTAALSHPNIVTIHAIERLEETLCIVMELVEQGDEAVAPAREPACRSAVGGSRAAHRDGRPAQMICAVQISACRFQI